jgi:hypothetical protein
MAGTCWRWADFGDEVALYARCPWEHRDGLGYYLVRADDPLRDHCDGAGFDRNFKGVVTLVCGDDTRLCKYRVRLHVDAPKREVSWMAPLCSKEFE